MASQKARREREFRRIEADLNRRIFPEPEEEQKSLFDRVVDNVVGRARYAAAYWSLLGNYVSAVYHPNNWQSKLGFINAAEADYDKAVSVYRKYSALRKGKAGQQRRWGLISRKLRLWDEDSKIKDNHAVLAGTLPDMVAEMHGQGREYETTNK